MKVSIEKLDHFGRGICYVDGKITFVSNALPGEVVSIEVVKDTKKYKEAKVKEIFTKSLERVKEACPYASFCGGCQLLHMSYPKTLEYKKQKAEEILSRYASLEKEVSIVESANHVGYRNKISLKVENGCYGYYQEATYSLVKIDSCLLVEPAIHALLKDFSYLHMEEGSLVIRTNFNQELLLSIHSKKNIAPDIEYLKSKHKLVGIVYNDKPYYGDTFFFEKIGNYFFKVSYDSFFQINRDICSKVFSYINENISDASVLLDLYCGVGTLGIASSTKDSKIYGIEVVKNAVLNAIENAKINKREAFYLLGEVTHSLEQIKEDFSVVVVDPPRAGLDKNTRELLLKMEVPTVVYMSCDLVTLARDLKELQEKYVVKELRCFDMFPYTHHVESVCVLSLKENQKS